MLETPGRLYGRQFESWMRRLDYGSFRFPHLTVRRRSEVKTELRPRALLDRIHVIERQAGRKRSVRWGPRTLDIDILWYDERRISEMHLQVPHPRIEERRFVLEPWSELAPELVLPSGRRVREALKIVTGQRVRRLGIGAEEE